MLIASELTFARDTSSVSHGKECFSPGTQGFFTKIVDEHTAPCNTESPISLLDFTWVCFQLSSTAQHRFRSLRRQKRQEVGFRSTNTKILSITAMSVSHSHGYFTGISMSCQSPISSSDRASHSSELRWLTGTTILGFAVQCIAVN
jgi:hypothetical protein